MQPTGEWAGGSDRQRLHKQPFTERSAPGGRAGELANSRPIDLITALICVILAHFVNALNETTTTTTTIA